VTALDGATTHARKAYNDHLAAQQAAKAATDAFYDKVRLMHASPGAGADMIQTIKTYAQTTNNPNVYVLAQIPPPAQVERPRRPARPSTSR
jgi:ribonuclease BN (tRNA processing enzyme)